MVLRHCWMVVIWLLSFWHFHDLLQLAIRVLGCFPFGLSKLLDAVQLVVLVVLISRMLHYVWVGERLSRKHVHEW